MNSAGGWTGFKQEYGNIKNFFFTFKFFSMYSKHLIQAKRLFHLSSFLWCFSPALFSGSAMAQCTVFFSYCPENVSIIDCDNSRREVISWQDPVANTTGACNSFSIKQVEGPLKGSIVGIGTYQITYLATSTEISTGKTSEAYCHFSVLVQADTESPVFTYCPSNITLYTGDGQSAIGKWPLPQAKDNCGPVIIKNGDYPCGWEFQIGHYEVVYTAIDASGNIAECIFTVTVESGFSRSTYADRGQSQTHIEATSSSKSNSNSLLPLSMSIMPNPFTNHLVLNASKQLDMNINVQVFDLQGHLLKVSLWSAKSDQLVLDATEMKPGIYCIKIFSADGSYVHVLRGVKF